MKTFRVLVVGSGAMGQHIAHYLKQSPKFELAGFVDDSAPRNEVVGLGRVLGGTGEIVALRDEGHFDQLLIAIGYKHFGVRKSLAEFLQGKVQFATLVHPASYVDPSCEVEEGVVVLPGCCIDKNVKIGSNVFINAGCVVSHDCSIGAHSFLAPGVTVAGNVAIGECSFLGVGATMSSSVALCPYSRVGAGAVVVSDILVTDWHVGVPARALKKEHTV